VLRAEDVKENELLPQGRLPAPVELPKYVPGRLTATRRRSQETGACFAPRMSKRTSSCYKEGFRLLSSYPNISAGGSPPHEDEDAHGDQGVQYCAPLGQRG
jgi:hypothetical protein